MSEAYLCDGVRTPIGKYGGALSSIRVDDLAAASIKALTDRNANVDWARLDDVILGCANQAGEDNRNVARMATLLAGLPKEAPGVTVNRLCGSGLSAIAIAASQIKSGEADLIIAGGVEGMSRAPYVMGKAERPFDRSAQLEDTTMGWRFVNKRLAERYGVEVMPHTAENVAQEFGVSREDQDKFSLASQAKTAKAIALGLFEAEIAAVAIIHPKTGDVRLVERDEHPRETSLERLASLKTLFKDGTVTAGNASGINDGAAALLIASEQAIIEFGLKPIARILGAAASGVAPRTMGVGPVPAARKLLARLSLSMHDLDVIELNEAFAAQSLACLRELGIADNDPRVNPLGGAIALGHPLGMSGARIVLTAATQLAHGAGERALCTMCVGVGQGVGLALQRA